MDFLLKLGFDWNEFWRPDVGSGKTINYVETPQVGLLPLPVFLLIVALISFVVILLIKRRFSWRALFSSALYSFMLAGSLLAVRMEYNWLKMFERDFNRFHGTDISERPSTVQVYYFYRLVSLMKTSVPEGEGIRAVAIEPEDKMVFFADKLANYFFLPVKVSEEGRYVWISKFHRASYDPGTGVLTIQGSRFKARLYRSFGDGAALYEIREDHR